MELTQEEKKLLKDIMSNKYSNGSFAGMIFNAVLSTDKTPDEVVKVALSTRVRLDYLASTYKPNVGTENIKESDTI